MYLVRGERMDKIEIFWFVDGNGNPLRNLEFKVYANGDETEVKIGEFEYIVNEIKDDVKEEIDRYTEDVVDYGLLGKYTTNAYGQIILTLSDEVRELEGLQFVDTDSNEVYDFTITETSEQHKQTIIIDDGDSDDLV